MHGSVSFRFLDLVPNVLVAEGVSWKVRQAACGYRQLYKVELLQSAWNDEV